MPLDKQSVEIPLGQGLAEKIGVRSLPIGRPRKVHNLVYRKSGELQRRAGYLGLPLDYVDVRGTAAGSVSLYAIGATESDLLGIGVRLAADGVLHLFEYAPSRLTWSMRGATGLPRFTTKKSTLCDGIQAPSTIPVSLEVSGRILTGWCAGNQWWMVVTDSVTGDVLWGPVALAGSNGFPATGCPITSEGMAGTICPWPGGWLIALWVPKANPNGPQFDVYFNVLSSSTFTFQSQGYDPVLATHIAGRWSHVDIYYAFMIEAEYSFKGLSAAPVAVTTMTLPSGQPSVMVGMLTSVDTDIFVLVYDPINDTTLTYSVQSLGGARQCANNVDFMQFTPAIVQPGTCAQHFMFLGYISTQVVPCDLICSVVDNYGAPILMFSLIHSVWAYPYMHGAGHHTAILRGCCAINSLGHVIGTLFVNTQSALGTIPEGWALDAYSVDMTFGGITALSGAGWIPASRGLILASQPYMETTNPVETKVLLRQASHEPEIIQGSYYLVSLQRGMHTPTVTSNMQVESCSLLRQVSSLQGYQWNLPSLAHPGTSYVVPCHYGSASGPTTNGGVVTGSLLAQGIARVEFQQIAQIPPMLQMGQKVIIPGGQPVYFDGDGTTDVGITWPEILGSTPNTSGGAMGDGDYYYRCQFEITHSDGSAEISGPSRAEMVTVAGVPAGNGSVSLYVEMPILSRDWIESAQTGFPMYPTITLTVYRTTVTDKVNFRLAQRIPLTSFAPIIVTDIISDAILMASGAPFMPTTGGPGEALEAVTPPSSTCGCVYAGRAWLGGTEEPDVIWYSTQQSLRTTPTWNEGFTVEIPGGGKVVALCPLGNKLVVLKESSVWIFYGEGPSSNGSQNDFSAPQCLSWAVGCVGPQTVTMADDGVYWQSSRGVHRLNQGVQIEFVGAAVEDEFTGLVATSAFTHDASQVVGWVVGGKLVLYDYVMGQWSTEDIFGAATAACTVLEGTRYAVQVDHQVAQGSTTRQMDTTAAAVNIDVCGWYETGDLRLSNVTGYQRAYAVDAIFTPGTARDGADGAVEGLTVEALGPDDVVMSTATFVCVVGGVERRVKALLPGYRMPIVRLRIKEAPKTKVIGATTSKLFILKGLVIELGVYPDTDRRPWADRTT